MVLKAPDLPEIAAEIETLWEKGIPVITLVTDGPLNKRIGYVGIDNRRPGPPPHA